MPLLSCPLRALRRGLYCIAAALLPACSAPDQSPFPVDPGRWWYYRTETTIRDEPLEQRLYVINVAQRGASLLQRRQTQWDHMYTVGADGIVHEAYAQRGAGGAKERKTLLLPKVIEIGASWTTKSRLRLIESRTFAAEDRLRGRYLPIDLETTIGSLDETVEVPSGRYSQCIRVDSKGATTVRADRGNILVEVRTEQQEWYAPGVGLVKSQRVESSKSPFLRDGRYLQELLEYGS